MYIDGHERDDVVAYRQEFVHRWAAEYETRFQIWDNDGNRLTQSSDSLPLILVTHDESTFFQNNERKILWSHQDSQPTPKPKGDGQSLMVSDFLTAEWGRLCNCNRCVNLFFFVTYFLIYSAERPALCLNQARTMMDTSMWTSSSPKLIAQSTSLKARQIAVRRAFSCSIMPPVT